MIDERFMLTKAIYPHYFCGVFDVHPPLFSLIMPRFILKYLMYFAIALPCIAFANPSNFDEHTFGSNYHQYSIGDKAPDTLPFIGINAPFKI